VRLAIEPSRNPVQLLLFYTNFIMFIKIIVTFFPVVKFYSDYPECV